MPRLKVLVVDDHAILRAGLRQLINGQHDMEATAEAGDGAEAVRKTRVAKPDVVLFDLTMPGTDAMETMRRILRARPRARIVVLSMHEDPAYEDSAMAAGAAGYVLKRAADSELFAAIRAASRGRVEAEGVGTTRAAARRTAEREPRRHHRGALLSPRESQVLRMLGRGYNNRQIAIRLRLSVKTVETFRARLSKKLGLRGRPSLVRYALRTGLLTFDQLARQGDD